MIVLIQFGSIDDLGQLHKILEDMWTPVLSVGGEQIQIYTHQSMGHSTNYGAYSKTGFVSWMTTFDWSYQTKQIGG